MNNARHLLGDVPQEAGGVEPQQPVVDGDFMERGTFLVAEERVRDPDLVPAALAQPNLTTAVTDN